MTLPAPSLKAAPAEPGRCVDYFAFIGEEEKVLMDSKSGAEYLHEENWKAKTRMLWIKHVTTTGRTAIRGKKGAFVGVVKDAFCLVNATGFLKIAMDMDILCRDDEVKKIVAGWKAAVAKEKSDTSAVDLIQAATSPPSTDAATRAAAPVGSPPPATRAAAPVGSPPRVKRSINSPSRRKSPRRAKSPVRSKSPSRDQSPVKKASGTATTRVRNTSTGQLGTRCGGWITTEDGTTKVRSGADWVVEK